MLILMDKRKLLKVAFRRIPLKPHDAKLNSSEIISGFGNELNFKYEAISISTISFIIFRSYFHSLTFIAKKKKRRWKGRTWEILGYDAAAETISFPSFKLCIIFSFTQIDLQLSARFTSFEQSAERTRDDGRKMLFVLRQLFLSFEWVNRDWSLKVCN